jgi:hypothetical protein
MKETNKQYPVISSCPICKHDLHVAKLECAYCGTSIEGNFLLSKFNYMEPEKLYFIEVFIKNRGSIKAIEKELNISYPTVKKMLDEVIVALGYSLDAYGDDTPVVEKEEPRRIKAGLLEKIEKGELSVADALEFLKKGK